MRKKSLAALGAAAALLTLGLGAGTAQAAPQSAPQSAPPRADNTVVHAWTSANVREQPNTWSPVLSYVSPGYTYDAICWTYGENITFEGVTTNKWVLIDRTWPRTNGYVTAAALSGDSTGGVPNQC